MASVRLSLSMGETKQQYKSIVNKLVKEIITSIITQIGIDVIDDIRAIFRGALKNSPEVQALLPGGGLYGEFGMRDGFERMGRIIDEWSEGIVFTVTPARVRGGIVRANISIYIMRTDYKEVINLPDAIFTTPENGYDLRWLEWLLFAGNKILIEDYSIFYESGSGRLGVAHMIDEITPSEFWRVPAEYAGTPLNNFATRALGDVLPLLEASLIRSFERAVGAI